ncbi:MAG: 50S ribosomal protein L29 [Mariprofundaceae bacterium]
MKMKGYRKLTDAELSKNLDELAAESMKLRFQKASMQLASPARVKQIRRDIARIRTILGERIRQEVGA